MAVPTVRHKEFGSDHGLIHEAVITGRKAGAGEAFWAALAHDKDLRLWPQVIALVQGDEFLHRATCSLAEAALIMGSNFHGPAAVKKHFGITLGRNQQWKSVPFSADELHAVADTHVLVAAPAVSLMEVYGHASQAFYSKHNPWYGERRQRNAFSDAKIEPGWYLIRKQEMPDSPRRNFAEQCGLVQPPDFVPEANLAAYAWVLHYLDSGERMFTRCWVRTASCTSKGLRVGLDDDVDGLIVSGWDDYAGGSVGVASARKSS